MIMISSFDTFVKSVLVLVLALMHTNKQEKGIIALTLGVGEE